MNEEELDAMKIIKVLIKPLIPTIVELIDDYREEQAQAAKNSVEPVVERSSLITENLYQVSNPDVTKEKSVQAVKRELSAEERLYNQYLLLPEDLRESMGGFIQGEGFENFMKSAVPIKRFWDFCKTEVQRQGASTSVIQILQDLFVFFMQRSAEGYQLYEPALDEKFDRLLMTASSTGKKVGIVKQVVLKGFYPAEQASHEIESIEHKAVVLLG